MDMCMHGEHLGYDSSYIIGGQQYLILGHRMTTELLGLFKPHLLLSHISQTSPIYPLAFSTSSHCLKVVISTLGMPTLNPSLVVAPAALPVWGEAILFPVEWAARNQSKMCLQERIIHSL